MVTKAKGFSDILTDPKSGEDVWVRWLWDGGAAYVITRRDEHHTCPACDGARTVTVLENGYGAMVVQPEHDEVCSACGGDGEIEALFGTDDDNNEKLLWPLDADDAEAGCDDL